MKGKYFTPKKDKVSFGILKQGQPCQFIPLNEKLAKRCLGFGLIETELNQAILLLSMIEGTENSHQSLALWQSSIMSYSRCFSRASGRKIRIEEKHVSGLPSGSIEFHRYLMGLRNEYIAHSGNNDVDRSFMVLGLAPQTEARGVENVFYASLASMGPESEKIEQFVVHCQLLIPVVTELRVKTENRLLANYRNQDINKLYEVAYSSSGLVDDAICIQY